MNYQDIMRMARQADLYEGSDDQVVRFAKLIAAAEREACAKVCDDIENGAFPDGNKASGLSWECADAIRARR